MVEKREQRFKAFFRWLQKGDHKTILSQVSMPRSGRYWLSHLMSNITDVCIGIPRHWDASSPDAIKYYHGHVGFANHTNNLKNVLLIRDPRDVLLSQVYWLVYLCEDDDHQSEQIAIDRFSEERFLLDQLEQWENYFKTFLPLDTIVVQYERLCLFPVAELERILDFFDFKAVRDVLAVVKKADTERRSYARPEFFPVDFANGLERYEAHCLRWKEDKSLNHLHERIWNRLGKRMEEWGYTKDGHATNLLR